MTHAELVILAKNKKAEWDSQKEKADELERKFIEVSNLFSKSVWKILPAKVKIFFEAYRNENEIN